MVAAARVAEPSQDDSILAKLAHLDVAGISHLVARRRRMSTSKEREAFERELIIDALKKHRGNAAAVARYPKRFCPEGNFVAHLFKHGEPVFDPEPHDPPSENTKKVFPVGRHRGIVKPILVLRRRIM